MATYRKGLDRNLGMFEHVTAEQRNEDGLRKIKWHADANMARFPNRDSRYILLYPHRLGDESPRLFVAGITGIGQLEDSRRAVNEIEAEFSLKSTDAS